MKKNFKIILITGLICGILTILAILTFDNKPEKITITESNSNHHELTENYEVNKYKNNKLVPDNIIVALYGTPGYPALGSLGEQSPEESVKRIKNIVREYSKFTDKNVVPAFEIITTIASKDATENNDFSRELSLDRIRPLVDIAEENNILVILDLQPGLSDFLSQAKSYEELLSKPHVSLALDPEWRLKPNQVHMKQIGSVNAEEINKTAQWLIELIKNRKLSQKLFLIHQFKLSMIENREKLLTSDDSLAWVIQMDGLGAQTTKQNTWKNIQKDLPNKINLGWKNFIDEDKPMLNIDETLNIVPQPTYISYQ